MQHIEKTQETQHVFISYMRENIDDVDRLCEELTSRGIKVWIDRNNIDPGLYWEDAIRKAICEGAFFIACFSKEYYERERTYMNAEVTTAIEDLHQRHTDRAWFIPVTLNECEIPDLYIGNKKTLRALQYVSLYEGWDNGIQRILKVIQPNPPELDSAEEYNKRGETYYKKGDLDSAIADYDKAIALDRDFHEAYNNRGNAYRDKEDFYRAINEYNRAIELAPEYPYPYNGRGDIYKNREEFDEAIKDYNTAIKLNPNYVPPYNSLGEVYFKKQEFGRAIESCVKAIELNPDCPLLYGNLGIIYRRKGEFDRAIETHTKAIEMGANSELPYNNRGNAYRDKGEFDRAIEDYTKAIELKENYAPAYCNRGNAYFYKGEYDRAIEDYSKAIDFKEDYGTAYSNRAQAHLHLQQWLSARVDFKSAKDMGYDIITSFHNDYESVEDFEEKMGIQLPPDIASILTPKTTNYNNRGTAYRKKGELDNAIKDYTTAIKLHPQLALAYYNRGEAWLHQKEWDKAKTDFKTAKQLGMDIIARFHNSYKDVETYQKNRLVKLPEDLALLLTQRRRDRYPKFQKVLEANGTLLESSHVVNLREQLRNAGPPLNEYINAKSAFGINTIPTEVFVVDKTTRDELIAAHRSSADILKPFLHGQEIRRWHVDTPQQWLIFTHRSITIDDYPAILKYLENHKESLQKRKGKQAWYELPASLDHAERFAQPKLVCPNVYNHHTFAIDTEGFYYGNTSYLIPTEEKWLCGLLNSRTVEWFYSQVSKQLTIDPLRARSGYIQQIPIPDITPVHKATITKIVDYLICLQQQPEINSEDLKYARDRIMLGYFERVIDGLIYEAYLREELHKSDKVFLQPLLDEQLPSIQEIQGDKMSAFRDIFERLYDRMHLVRRHLYYLDSIKPIRILQGKL